MTLIASYPADMRITLKAVAFALCCVPAPAIAAKGLAHEVEINEGLIAISMANAVRETCPSISARLLRAWFYITSLEAEARSLGYSPQEVSAFVKDPVEKSRVLSIAQKRLADHGVIPDQPATYCTFGLAEIQAGSAIGKLLKAN